MKKDMPEVSLYLCKKCLKVTCAVSTLKTIQQEVTYFLDEEGEVDSIETGDNECGIDPDSTQCVMCGEDKVVELCITKEDLLALPQDVKDALGVGTPDGCVTEGLQLAKFIELVNTKVKLLNMDVAELVTLIV